MMIPCFIVFLFGMSMGAAVLSILLSLHEKYGVK